MAFELQRQIRENAQQLQSMVQGFPEWFSIIDERDERYRHQYQKLEGAHPTAPVLSTAERVEQLADQGKVHFSAHNYDKAVQFYSRALDLKRSVRFFTNRSLCYWKMGMHDEALNDAVEGLKLDSTHQKANMQRVRALRSLGRYQDALDAIHVAYGSIQNPHKQFCSLEQEIAELLRIEADRSGVSRRKVRVEIISDEDSDEDADRSGVSQRKAPVEIRSDEHSDEDADRSGVCQRKARVEITSDEDSDEDAEVVLENVTTSDSQSPSSRLDLMALAEALPVDGGIYELTHNWRHFREVNTAWAHHIHRWNPARFPLILATAETMILRAVFGALSIIRPFDVDFVVTALTEMSKMSQIKMMILLLPKPSRQELKDLFVSLLDFPGVRELAPRFKVRL